MASKYKNIVQHYKGMRFDSKKELERYIELELLEKAGKIKHLQVQVIFRFDALNFKSIFKSCPRYIADFVYFDVEKNCKVVEDTKSKATKSLPVFKYKKALMKYFFNIEVIVL